MQQLTWLSPFLIKYNIPLVLETPHSPKSALFARFVPQHKSIQQRYIFPEVKQIVQIQNATKDPNVIRERQRKNT